MRRAFAILVLCLSGAAWAQTLSCTQPVISFDFGSTLVSGGVTVNGTTYDRAGLGAYSSWLGSGAQTKRFSPTGTDVRVVCDFVARTNPSKAFAWTVTLRDVTSSLGAPLDNSRVYIYVEKVSGLGQSQVTTLTPISPSMLLASDGDRSQVTQGGGRYAFHFVLEMRAGDKFPPNYSSSIFPNYLIQ